MRRIALLNSYEGVFVPQEIEVTVKKKTRDAFTVRVGDWTFHVWKLSKASREGPGWGWHMEHNGRNHHHWDSGDVDDNGELLGTVAPAKTRAAALKKCLLSAMRWQRDDLAKLQFLYKRVTR